MQDAVLADAAPASLPRLLELWQYDAATAALLRQVGPAVSAALNGIETEFDAVFRADPGSERVLADPELRRQEVQMLTQFCGGIFRGEFDGAAAGRAADLGRHYADLGLDATALLAASQRVLRRAYDGIFAARPADPMPMIDAVTRLVLLGADIALASLQRRAAERAEAAGSDRQAEEMQEHIHALEEMARVDALTKLFNRRHFDMTLEAEVSRAHRYDVPLSLIMADVDFFKRINDNYGHLIGDEVLCHVAEVLQAGARRSDMIARYGGEEFALILTSTPGENAEPVAERMRSGLEQRPVAFADGQMLRVTMSLGYASLQKGDTPKSLIERADAALYRAKAAGRNRVSA
jgi:diguanylate cyclase (GGDEF)-like protein